MFDPLLLHSRGGGALGPRARLPLLSLLQEQRYALVADSLLLVLELLEVDYLGVRCVRGWLGGLES